ncbi:MAG TPA: serine/threonine-protein kinase [Polyangiaceae bacterium]|nr:serine/threonine-protein kinase [Polyangiaceae bacterium]
MDVGQGTLPAGFQFGAYVIGSCIGRGGMARIYRAEHRVLHKPVALKVMESALLERPDGRPRFLREGQAAAAVKHPNVVDITDVGVWQGRPYLVMELLEGEDLEQYLSRHKPLAEQDAARILIPIIAGLATAHAAGVIHRDLKPSNVFLSRGPDGEVVPKLLDFGISKLANALRTLGKRSPGSRLIALRTATSSTVDRSGR